MKYIVSGSEDMTLRLWDFKTGKQLRVFEGHTGKVEAVSFSPDGKHIASGSWDDTLRLWNLETGQVRVFEGHTGRVEAVSFSPDGKHIASGSWDDTLRLWNLETGQVRVFEGHSGLVSSVSFSPDGKNIASGSSDKTIRLWNLETDMDVQVFQGHTNWVASVAFDSDGKRIVSGSWDGSLKIWNKETGKPLVTIVPLVDNEWIVYTPDNYYTASSEGDKYISFLVGEKTYNLDQYSNIYKRPDIIESILHDENVDKLVAKIEVDTGIQISKLSIVDISPPEIVIQFIESGDLILKAENRVVDSPAMKLVAQAVDRKFGIDQVIVELNGKNVFEKKGIGKEEIIIEAPIILEKPENIVRVMAYSTKNIKSYPRELHITYKEDILKGKSLHEIARVSWGKSKSWAVVIGIDNYSNKNGWKPLPYAVNDAKAVKALLIKDFGFAADHIISLYNADATKTKIERLIGDELKNKVAENDRVLIFFSGHGDTQSTKNKKIGYFVPIDGDVNSPYSTYVSMSQLGNLADLIPAKQIIFIIDACYSGIGGLQYKGKEEKETRNQVEIFIKSGGRQLLTAGTSEEKAEMSEKWNNHSVYTYFLLKGLKGEADYNNDEVISTHELQVYLETTVPKEAKQHPQMFNLGDGEGQFIFYREGEI